MNALPQEEFCPRCGQWVTILDDYSGWCTPCATSTTDCAAPIDGASVRRKRPTTTGSERHMSRYDATVSDVRHWTQPADKRQDVDRVLAHLDYADGAAWWLVDKGTVKVGDRYRVTVETFAGYGSGQPPQEAAK